MSNPDCKDLVNSSKERDCCGLREILAVILKLQENADKFDPILATCDRPFLDQNQITNASILDPSYYTMMNLKNGQYQLKKNVHIL